MQATRTLVGDRELAASKLPLTADGDSREIWALDRKICITRQSATEYRIVVLDSWGKAYDGYTRTETTEPAARKIARGYWAEFTGYELPFTETATEVEPSSLTPVEVARDREPHTGVAGDLQGNWPVNDNHLTDAQRRLITAATDGHITRSADANIRTLIAMARRGWGDLTRGNWSGRGRTNEITGLVLTPAAVRAAAA